MCLAKEMGFFLGKWVFKKNALVQIFKKSFVQSGAQMRLKNHVFLNFVIFLHIIIILIMINNLLKAIMA